MGQILLSFQSTTYQVVVAYLIAQSCPALVNSWTVAHQAPLSLGFSRQEYWSGLPFPLAGDLPHPGIEPGSPALQADSLLSESPVQFSRSVLSDSLRLHESQPGKPLKAKILG